MHETRNPVSELALTSRADPEKRQVIARGLAGWAKFYFMKRAGYIAMDGQRDGFVDLETGKFRHSSPRSSGSRMLRTRACCPHRMES